MNTTHLLAALALALVALAHSTRAQDLSATDPRPVTLPGATQTDGWNNFTRADNPGYPGFPGTNPWPRPIGSNRPGSGDATLNKVIGGAYPADRSIYFGGFSSAPNTFGATLAFSDPSAVAGLQTVVLQLQFGEAFGFDLFNGTGPTLSYNGGAQNLAATFSTIAARVQNGTDSSSGNPEPIYVNLHFLQWDLRGLTDPVTDYNITFSGVQHSQLYGAQLDQSDTFQAVTPVPEPAAWAGMVAAALGVLALQRRVRPRRA